MTTTAIPNKPANINLVGLGKADYKGAPSTLCNGCGHDSIASQIIAVAYDLSLAPHRIVKFSGIGCSSKSPAYFLGRSHSINGLHGRMPSLATGALTVNRDMTGLGVSGDGDTGSIGFGQFKHMLRRNVDMVYIIENNGVYGLTKGQFSATADIGQELKYAGKNELPPIDLCLEAIASGAGFVARSFAGDPKQVQQLLKAALSYRGTAVLDIISPCVTFNNSELSTKGYTWGKEHEEALHEVRYVMPAEEITVEYERRRSEGRGHARRLNHSVEEIGHRLRAARQIFRHAHLGRSPRQSAVHHGPDLLQRSAAQPRSSSSAWSIRR